MRVNITETTIYTFEELDERTQQKAIENVSAKLNGDWWDSSDTDTLREAIVYGLAAALQAPGWDTFGMSDFPGIDGFKLEGFDLDRGERVDFKGTLTRENAPALPWVDSILSVVVGSREYGRRTYLEEDDDLAPTEDERIAMVDAVDAAFAEALSAGRKENEYMASDEYAREWIESKAPEFTEDGDLWFGEGQ